MTGRKQRSLRVLLLIIIILLSFVIAAQVFGAGLWFLDSTPYPTDFPFPKQTMMESIRLTQVIALQSPTPHPGGAIIGMGPTPDPIQLELPQGTPMGDGVLTDDVGMHRSEYMGSFHGNLLVWVTEAENGRMILVYAGVEADDPEQGLIYVVRTGTIWQGDGEKFILPTRSGKPDIIDAAGQRLIIETEGGDSFYFDVPASKFASSLNESLPTRTPGPTLTPRVTPTPVSGDDVSNNPSGAGIFPLNTDLVYKISPADDQDWFVFPVMNTHPLQASLKNQPAPYKMNVIYAEDPQIIGSSTEPDSNDKLLLFNNVEPGFYYILIEGINSSSNSQDPYILRFSDYQLEWLPPVGDLGIYTSTVGVTIPIFFTVNRFSGEMVIDETVHLSLLDSNGTLVMGPYDSADNPDDGIFIDPSGEYSLNLLTRDLEPGTYTLLVTFEEIGGKNSLDIILKANLAPLVFIGGAETIDEGEVLERSGGFLDLDSSSWTGLVDYGLGDGFIPLLINSDNSFTLSEVYPDNGLYSVTVQITDEQQTTGEVSFEVTANNLSPIVTVGGYSFLNEGETFTGSGSFVDPGEDSWTATVDYGDGSGPETLELTGQSFDLEHVYQEDGDYSITVCVLDDDGGEGCDVLELAVDNLSPVVTMSGDTFLNEGDTFIGSGSFLDPGEDSWTATVNYGAGNGPETLKLTGQSFNLEYLYPEDGSYTIGVCVADDNGGEGCAALELDVDNVPPIITMSGDSILNEGMTFSGSGSFSDPGTDSWNAAVDYGDGNGQEALMLTDQSFGLEHQYLDDGFYKIDVCVTDDDGGEGCAALELAVDNEPPIVDAGADQARETGQEVIFSGSYRDPGALDSHTLSWDFGDGGVAEGILNPSHVYFAPGNYTVTLTVTDDEGASGSDSLIVEVTQGPGSDVIVLLDRRTNNCLTLDLESGAYTWNSEDSTVYSGSADLVERGAVLLIRSSAEDAQYLRGVLITRNEFGIVRLRAGKWFRPDWFFIFDRDYTDPQLCP